jgi:hypothetical protein
LATKPLRAPNPSPRPSPLYCPPPPKCPVCHEAGQSRRSCLSLAMSRVPPGPETPLPSLCHATITASKRDLWLPLETKHELPDGLPPCRKSNPKPPVKRKAAWAGHWPSRDPECGPNRYRETVTQRTKFKIGSGQGVFPTTGDTEPDGGETDPSQISASFDTVPWPPARRSTAPNPLGMVTWDSSPAGAAHAMAYTPVAAVASA